MEGVVPMWGHYQYWKSFLVARLAVATSSGTHTRTTRHAVPDIRTTVIEAAPHWDLEILSNVVDWAVSQVLGMEALYQLGFKPSHRGRVGKVQYVRRRLLSFQEVNLSIP